MKHVMNKSVIHNGKHFAKGAVVEDGGALEEFKKLGHCDVVKSEPEAKVEMPMPEGEAPVEAPSEPVAPKKKRK